MSDLQELADRLAIRDLIERYTLSVTLRDWDAMGECFHLHARWQVAPPMEMDFLNREGIKQGISDAVNASDFLVQMTHSAVIDNLTADRATARVVLNEIGRMTPQHSGFFLLGVYDDTITKIDGKWRFEHRIFRPHYLDTTWLPGTVMVEYSAK